MFSLFRGGQPSAAPISRLAATCSVPDRLVPRMRGSRRQMQDGIIYGSGRHFLLWTWCVVVDKGV
ncbi:uncharacterized protein P884DRAFT_254507 [Thermothelomyces heterothallicus CBS 202.75]|uniref:uncharacterized protein n=1 Tax=Thermothelomyces heterothallicus CBS 202.75 TaxID=1149848 RepID=UPI0037428DC9